MHSLKLLLCAALAASLLLSAPEAEARFGKRSSSSSDSGKKEKKKEERKEEPAPSRVHDASPATPGGVHDASPVGSSPPPPPPPPRRRAPKRAIVVHPSPPPPGYYAEPEPLPGYYAEPEPPPPGYFSEPRRIRGTRKRAASREDPLRSTLRLDMGLAALGGGYGLDLHMGFEGERLGLDSRLTGLGLPAEDGSGDTDTLSLAGAHLTYALLTHERLRWRVEGGLTLARAPDLTVVGPSLGTSLEARLARYLTFELRLQATPLPYRQADAQAALALKSYPWAMRLGWRTLLLDDAGLVDGVVHRDLFNGPFLGFGLFF